MRSRWRKDLSILRKLPDEERGTAFRAFISKECGQALNVRAARSRLFMITCGALRGSPRLIAVDDEEAILMSLADLQAIVLDISLARFLEGLQRLPKRQVTNR